MAEASLAPVPALCARGVFPSPNPSFQYLCVGRSSPNTNDGNVALGEQFGVLWLSRHRYGAAQRGAAFSVAKLPLKLQGGTPILQKLGKKLGKN